MEIQLTQGMVANINDEEAARAYDTAILPLAGEFARLNLRQAA